MKEKVWLIQRGEKKRQVTGIVPEKKQALAY